MQEILPCQVVLDDDEKGAVITNMKGRFLYDDALGADGEYKFI